MHIKLSKELLSVSATTIFTQSKAYCWLRDTYTKVSSNNCYRAELPINKHVWFSRTRLQTIYPVLQLQSTGKAWDRFLPSLYNHTCHVESMLTIVMCWIHFCAEVSSTWKRSCGEHITSLFNTLWLLKLLTPAGSIPSLQTPGSFLRIIFVNYSEKMWGETERSKFHVTNSYCIQEINCI